MMMTSPGAVVAIWAGWTSFVTRSDTLNLLVGWSTDSNPNANQRVSDTCPDRTSDMRHGSVIASPVRASFTRPEQMARPGQAQTSPERTPQAAAAAREERL